MTADLPPAVPAQPAAPHFHRGVLAIDAAATAARIQEWLHETVARHLHRRGAVVAVSGGVDSAVCAALAQRTFGAERVHALFLPGHNSQPASGERARALCAGLGIPLEEQPIEPALRELGCYAARDAAIRSVFPEYRPGDRYKIAIAGGLLERDRASVFDLVVERPDGTLQRARLPLDAYLQLVAATNMKQRTRMLLSYHAAERRNYAVIGTPNRLEYAQGFFVRGGDGLADCKPIAHLYKTQVFQLAAHLGVPRSIQDAVPSTDTYSLPQTQEEFFFALPYGELDLLLWAQDHNVPIAEVARAMDLPEAAVLRVFRDLDSKRAAARRLLQQAPLVENAP
jgi:NAD+ synthase